jgi:hypothetical protein
VRVKTFCFFPLYQFNALQTDPEGNRHAPTYGMGTLPCINYGGIEKSCQQFQSYFRGARSGSAHISSAISAGLRGADLFDALRMDFNCWMAVRPDM